jgi:drug/metabolite transporter (DMT)-like permease
MTWPAVACGPVARAVSAFMVCSAAMIVVNKQVVRALRLPLTVLWIQMAAATLALAPYVWKRASLRPWSDAVRWARVVPPLFAAMLATGMLALKFASLGAVIVGRNATPLLALPLEAAVLRERPPASAWTWASLVAVLVGAVLYIDEDLGRGTSAAGVVFLVLNMLAATAERLAQRLLLAVRPVRLAQSALLLINNALGALLVAIAIPLVPLGPYGRPETHSLSYLRPADTRTIEDVEAYALLAFSCACGLAIGWTALRAQLHLSATSMLVVTNLNKVAVVVAGVVCFGETRTARALLGITAALLGGAAYGALQHADLAKRGPKWRKAGGAALALHAALLLIVLADVATPRSDGDAPVRDRPAMPRVEFRGAPLDPSEAQIRRVPGSEGLSIMPAGSKDLVTAPNGRASTMWNTMLRDPHDGSYHFVTRICRGAEVPHRKWQGDGLYYARYTEHGFQLQLANPALPWHGPGSHEQHALVVANMDSSNCTMFDIVEDPRFFLLDSVPHVIITGGPHMWIAALDPLLRDTNCSAWVRLHAEPPPDERCQKNWAPFEHEGALHVVYSWHPLVVLRCDPNTGRCVRTDDVAYPSRMRRNNVHGGTQLVPMGEGRWLSFVHSRHRCAVLNSHLHNAMLVVVTFSESSGFELRYMSDAILPWRGYDDPNMLAFVNEATGIVSANASVDEVLITTNEMSSYGRLARLTGAYALAEWGATQRGDEWYARYAAELDAVCARVPAPPEAERLASAAWGLLGTALTAALAATCAVAWLRAQGYVVAAKGYEERAAIVTKAVYDVCE